MGSQQAEGGSWTETVRALWDEAAFSETRRWARPEAPVLHDLVDEKAEPSVFYHNTNYRISRKFINVEKVKVGSMHARPPARPCASARCPAAPALVTHAHKRVCMMGIARARRCMPGACACACVCACEHARAHASVRTHDALICGAWVVRGLVQHATRTAMEVP